MHKQTAFYVAIFATVALAIGWQARSYRGAANNVKAAVRELARQRSARGRLAGLVTLLVVLSGAVLWVLATKHHHH
ncbi:MAG TPA: hypothetical protein VF834_09120 [Streptosporangiaceae bacterium]